MRYASLERWLRVALVPVSLAVLTGAVAPFCGARAISPFRVALPGPDGLVAVEVVLPDGAAAAAQVLLDGMNVNDSFEPGGPGLLGELPPGPPGTHGLTVTYPASDGITTLTGFGSFDSPSAAPAFLDSLPRPGALNVVRTAWLRLRFLGPVPADALAGWGFGLECDGERMQRTAVRVAGLPAEGSVEDSVVLLNPNPELPPGARCSVVWSGPSGRQSMDFVVATGTTEAPVPYDRTDLFQIAPFPDDYWLVEEDGSRHLDIQVAPYERFPLNAAANGIAVSASGFDGFSPVQPIVIELPGLVPTSQLPGSEFESLDPFSRVAIFDIDPESPDFGERIPFTARSSADPFFRDGTTDFSLVLFPAPTLRAGGQYGIVLTRRLHVPSFPVVPFGPSPFFAGVAGEPSLGEAPERTRARESIGPLLDFLEDVPAVPIPKEDVALAIRFTIRSRANDPADWIAVTEDHLAGPTIALDIASTSGGADGSVVIRGTIDLPSYLDASLVELNRDPVSGRPVAADTEAVPFVLMLPKEARDGPVPIVIYSHGSPGSPEEITYFREGFLREAGYAVIGIQDWFNRRFGESRDAIFTNGLGIIIAQQATGLGGQQTQFDTIGLLRGIRWLGEQSLLPLGAPDAIPEVDASRILFRGFSFGAHRSLAVLPFMPEVTAAASVVGGGRDSENQIHQVGFFGDLAFFQELIPDASPVLILTALAALQNSEDRFEPHLLARYLYREPVAVPGQTDNTPPSLLWLEGVGDSFVSNTATRSAARELGIPQVGNVVEPTPILPQAEAPLAENVAPGVTGGHYQYDPEATPSCVDAGELEGHFCPIIATEAQEQIRHFFATSLEGRAEILDPLAVVAD